VAEHPSRKVDANRCPAQFAHTRGGDAGAAADVQADAVASSQKVSQRLVDAEGIGTVAQSASGLPAARRKPSNGGWCALRP
jgi:hypothetical protein